MPKINIDLAEAILTLLKDKSTPYILLIGSITFVVFSIIHKNFFSVSFITFIFAALATFLNNILKHESVTIFSKKEKLLYGFFLTFWGITFHLLIFIWVAIIVLMLPITDVDTSKTLIKIVSENKIIDTGTRLLIGSFLMTVILYSVGSLSLLNHNNSGQSKK